MASIDKRPDGSYRVRYRVRRGGAQIAQHFPRKHLAERFKTEIEHQLQRGTYVSPADAAEEFAAYSVKYLERQAWKPRTHKVADLAMRRAAEAWPDRRLVEIKSPDVQAFVSELGSRLAPSTVRTNYQHVSALFRMAVADGVLGRNPCVGIRLPKPTEGKVDPLTSEQVRRLHEAAPEWFRIAVVLGAGLALRQSEARGLTLDRVRFLHREVRVDRQADHDRRGFVSTKTANSVRTIPAADPVLRAIAAHVDEHGTSDLGHVLHHRGAEVPYWKFGDAWRLTAERAGVEGRFHDLRHHLASELLSDGASVVAVASVLGDRPATVYETYAHLVHSDEDRVRSTVGRLWGAEDLLRTGNEAAGL